MNYTGRPSISGCRPVLSLYPTHRFCQYLLLIFITFTNSFLFNRAFSTNSRRPSQAGRRRDSSPRGEELNLSVSADALPLPGLRLPASASLPLASCWPLPQQLLPVSAAGGGRRRCSQRERLRRRSTFRRIRHIQHRAEGVEDEASMPLATSSRFCWVKSGTATACSRSWRSQAASREQRVLPVAVALAESWVV